MYILSIVLLLTIASTAGAATNKKKATWTASDVIVDGSDVRITGFNIDGSNYFKLRDVAASLAGTAGEFNVAWNKASNAIELKKGVTYTGGVTDDYYNYFYTTQNAVASSSKIIVDGQSMDTKVYTIDDASYFQLRDLGKFAGFDVQFVSKQNEIHITSPNPSNAFSAKASAKLIDHKSIVYFPRWKRTVDSYLYHNNDQTMTALEANETINIATYDANYRLLSSATVKYELPVFGAFYSGEQYNYIAFGQTNKEENDNKEIIRIVKYDKQFNKISSASLLGGAGYTITPFDVAAGRIAEHGDTLVYHTSRERYLTEDGLNHQSQLTLIVDTTTMKILNDTGRFQANHVSHSFDQYVLFDGDEHVLLDHGDAFPRSIVLNKGDGFSYVERDVVNIPGSIGANATGVSIGGFEMSSSSYLVAYNTIDHSKAKRYTSFGIEGIDIDQRDVMIAAVPKSNIETGKIKQVVLGSYVGTKKMASIPQLVKVTDNKFMVMWQQYEGIPDDTYSNLGRGHLKYVYIDGEGNKLGDVQSVKYFNQSTVQPIVFDNKVVWYTNDNNKRTFYTIPIQ